MRAVVGLSEALGVVTNAEGVETAAQADLVHGEGCREMQGFLYGEPMPLAVFGRLVEDKRITA